MEHQRPLEPPPAPEGARTPGEFVSRLRALKSWSGLSYRQLERNAAREGGQLPPSTIVGALSRDRLPREEMLETLVRACGCNPGEVAGWLAVRRRVAAADQRPSWREDPGGDDAPSPGDPRKKGRLAASRTVLLAAAGVATGLGLLAAGSALLSGASSSGTPQVAGPRRSPGTEAGGPPSGPYRFRLAHSGLCLSERDDTGGRVHQISCARAFPPRKLQAEADGTYTVTTDHPQQGPGCMGVRGAHTTPGGYVFDDFCGANGANDGGVRFRLEKVATPAGGFTLRPAHNNLCLGIANASKTEGAVVSQLPCDPAGTGQIFFLDPKR